MAAEEEGEGVGSRQERASREKQKEIRKEDEERCE
jgi:hypothetical protein